MKKLIATLVVVSLLAALGVAAATASGGEPVARKAATRGIEVDDNRFRSTDTGTIRRGKIRLNEDDIIRFEWTGTNTHNVVKTGRGGNRVESELTDETGYVYRKRFTKDTKLICDVHPLSMKLTVDVKQDD